MVIVYLDTSAAMKVLVEEAESAALTGYLTTTDDRMVASWLLRTELHCAAARNPAVIRAEDVQIVLDTIALVDTSRGDFVTAPTMPGSLRSNDALHLTVAARLGVDAMVTYDVELARAAAALGIQVRCPR